MLKYTKTQVTFLEVPDHISLCLDISNCPFRCKNCHSPELWKDVGTELTFNELTRLIDTNLGIDCVCFLGHGNSFDEINELSKYVKEKYKDLKICVYTGLDDIPIQLDWNYIDFIKIGHYDEEKGGLSSKTTNQQFFHVERNECGNFTFTKIFFE